jgi:hypothetical protein
LWSDDCAALLHSRDVARARRRFANGHSPIPLNQFQNRSVALSSQRNSPEFRGFTATRLNSCEFSDGFETSFRSIASPCSCCYMGLLSEAARHATIKRSVRGGILSSGSGGIRAKNIRRDGTGRGCPFLECEFQPMRDDVAYGVHSTRPDVFATPSRGGTGASRKLQKPFSWPMLPASAACLHRFGKLGACTAMI